MYKTFFRNCIKVNIAGEYAEKVKFNSETGKFEVSYNSAMANAGVKEGRLRVTLYRAVKSSDKNVVDSVVNYIESYDITFENPPKPHNPLCG